LIKTHVNALNQKAKEYTVNGKATSWKYGLHKSNHALRRRETFHTHLTI